LGKQVIFLSVLLIVGCMTITEPIFCSAEIAEDTWDTKAPMNEARSDMRIASVNGKIYAIGGSASHSSQDTAKTLATNEEYNPQTDTWTLKKPMPTVRYFFEVAVYQDKIYCIGGKTPNGTLTGINEMYDTSTDTWETKTAMPTIRLSFRANTLDNKIYVVGGYDAYTGFDVNTVSTNEVYDPSTDTWTTKALSPIATRAYASAVCNDKLYLFGGLTNELKDIGNITQIYNPQTDSWSFGASSLEITTCYKAVTTTGIHAPQKIYTFDTKLSSHNRSVTEMIYDPATNTWSIGTPMPNWRYNFDVCNVDDIIYVIGGCNTTFPDPYSSNCIITQFALNEQYFPGGYTIAELPTVTPPTTNQQNTSLPPANQVDEITFASVVTGIVLLAVAAGVVGVYLKRRRSLPPKNRPQQPQLRMQHKTQTQQSPQQH
jgi:N-acetylneuraminic acid mutarotase